MAKSGQSRNTESISTLDYQSMEKRLQELEFKSTFLERELEEYKEASRGFYKKINELEEEIRKLQKDVQESDLPTPEVTWDSEGRDIRP